MQGLEAANGQAYCQIKSIEERSWQGQSKTKKDAMQKHWLCICILFCHNWPQ